MKVTITRNPSKVLAAALSDGNEELAKKLVEGETVDLSAKQAQLAIESNVAEPASAEDKAKRKAEEDAAVSQPTHKADDLQLERARRDPEFRAREEQAKADAEKSADESKSAHKHQPKKTER